MKIDAADIYESNSPVLEYAATLPDGDELNSLMELLESLFEGAAAVVSDSWR